MSAADVRKAAVLLASLPEEDAARVLARLAPDEIETVAVELARLDRVDHDEQTAATGDFAQACLRRPGGAETAARLVERALGPRAGHVLERVYRRLVATNRGIPPAVDGRALAPLLVYEHPQTIALVLSRLPPEQAAETLGGLPTDTQSDVVRRIATMGEAGRDAIRDLEQGLAARMASVADQQFVSTGGVDRAARLLAAADGSTRRQVIDSLAQDHPGLVAEIHRELSTPGGSSGTSGTPSGARASAA